MPKEKNLNCLRLFALFPFMRVEKVDFWGRSTFFKCQKEAWRGTSRKCFKPTSFPALGQKAFGAKTFDSLLRIRMKLNLVPTFDFSLWKEKWYRAQCQLLRTIINRRKEGRKEGRMNKKLPGPKTIYQRLVALPPTTNKWCYMLSGSIKSSRDWVTTFADVLYKNSKYYYD